jgi:chitinase
MTPEEIPLGYYTHIFFSFSLIDPETFRLTPMDSDTGTLYQRVSAIKARSPDVEVWIAIGGWAMNDPGATRTTFSDLAKSTAAQEEFFESLVTFLQNNGFDGVDIDWEYPMADDRTLDFCFPFLRRSERHAPKAPPADFKT